MCLSSRTALKRQFLALLRLFLRRVRAVRRGGVGRRPCSRATHAAVTGRTSRRVAAGAGAELRRVLRGGRSALPPRACKALAAPARRCAADGGRLGGAEASLRALVDTGNSAGRPRVSGARRSSSADAAGARAAARRRKYPARRRRGRRLHAPSARTRGSPERAVPHPLPRGRHLVAGCWRRCGRTLPPLDGAARRRSCVALAAEPLAGRSVRGDRARSRIYKHTRRFAMKLIPHRPC